MQNGSFTPPLYGSGGENKSYDEIWQTFAGTVPSGTIKQVTLKVYNGYGCYNSHSHVQLSYSKDGGSTWTDFFNITGPIADNGANIASVILTVAQDLTKVQIKAHAWNDGSDNHASTYLNIYEIWLEVVVAVPVLYGNGATIDSLQPSQAGADKTSSNIAAGIAGQGALATQNQINLDTQAIDGTYGRPLANQLQQGLITGLAYGKNIIPNPSFDQNSIGFAVNTAAIAGNLVDNWLIESINNSGMYVVVAQDMGGYHSGVVTNHLTMSIVGGSSIANGVTAQGVVDSTLFQVTGGQSYIISGALFSLTSYTLPPGITTALIVRMWFKRADGSLTGTASPNLTVGTDGAWHYVTGTQFTAPADAATGFVQCIFDVVNTTGASYTVPSGQAIVGSVDDLTGVCLTDLANEVSSRGSIPPSLAGSMSYVCTNNSITWTWTGIQILRSDGTTTSVTNGSMAVTGLAPSTIYAFYPYWDENGQALSFVTGGGGSNGTAFSASGSAVAAQLQNLMWRIPLSGGGMPGATTTSGSGGGSGGGSGSCVRSTMLVNERRRGIIPAYEVEVGDSLKCATGWMLVLEAEAGPCDLFVRVLVDGEYLEVTPWHPFTAMDESCNLIEGAEASRLTLLHQLFTLRGAGFVEELKLVSVVDGQKIMIRGEFPHTFYAGEAKPHILAHNTILPC